MNFMPPIKSEFLNYNMTRAILDGRKFSIRRLIKFSGHRVADLLYPTPIRSQFYPFSAYSCYAGKKVGLYLNPRHRPGDIIYVREPFAEVSSLPGISDTVGVIYMADFSPVDLRSLEEKGFRWKSGFHMPSKYARIFLRIKNVRPEHLNEISEQEAIREGIYEFGTSKNGEGIKYTFNLGNDNFFPSAVDAFADFWDSAISIHDLPLFGWLSNPMVWVYEFEIISKAEVFCERGDKVNGLL